MRLPPDTAAERQVLNVLHRLKAGSALMVAGVAIDHQLNSNQLLARTTARACVMPHELRTAVCAAELPSRALPFTELMICALAQLASERQWWDTAVLLILGFHVFPRSAEVFSARKAELVFDFRDHAVWSLPLTKSGQRVGAKESLIVDDVWATQLLKQFLKPLMPGDRLSSISGQGQRQRITNSPRCSIS